MGVQKICAHFTSENPQQLNLPWEQELLRSLLFSSTTSLTLTDLIRQREAHASFSQTGSILWSMLRLYAKCRDADQSFEHFSNELARGCSQRDYRLRWLSQLVLRHQMNTEAMSGGIAVGQGVYGKQGTIDDPFFVEVSGKYIRQLLL